MAISKESLLKFSKATELVVVMIDDDSSGPSANNPEGTIVKVLHLQEPVSAVGSNPTASGQEMRVTGQKVHVAAANWEKFLEQAEEKEGVIRYKGDMHLDVSKPDGRMVAGQFVVTKQAKIWLTAVKFSKSGGALNQGRVNSLNNLIDTMFKGNKPLDLAVETGVAAGDVAADIVDKELKTIPEVVVGNGSVDKVLEIVGGKGNKGPK